MNSPSKETGYAAARRVNMFHWPGACHVCGDDTWLDRPLDETPGRRGRARYRCRACGITFERSAWRVLLAAQAAR